jgi:hypothetical protein
VPSNELILYINPHLNSFQYPLINYLGSALDKKGNLKDKVLMGPLEKLMVLTLIYRGLRVKPLTDPLEKLMVLTLARGLRDKPLTDPLE